MEIEKMEHTHLVGTSTLDRSQKPCMNELNTMFSGAEVPFAMSVLTSAGPLVLMSMAAAVMIKIGQKNNYPFRNPRNVSPQVVIYSRKPSLLRVAGWKGDGVEAVGGGLGVRRMSTFYDR